MTTYQTGFLVIWLVVGAFCGALMMFKTGAVRDFYLNVMRRSPKLGSKYIVSPDYVASSYYVSQMRIAGALIWGMDIFVIWAIFSAR